jgi:hypothetical protein
MTVLTDLIEADITAEAKVLGVHPLMLFLIKRDPNGPLYRMYEQLKACPADTAAAIREDARRPTPTSLGRPEPSVERGSGWVTPLGLSVPGVSYVDRLCDAADARDRAERLHQEMRQQAEAMEFAEKVEAEQKKRAEELDPEHQGLYDKPKKKGGGS